jgi:hypothetical protein
VIFAIIAATKNAFEICQVILGFIGALSHIGCTLAYFVIFGKLKNSI